MGSKQHLLDMTGPLTHELTVDVVAHTRSSLSKVLQLRVESLEKDCWLLIVNEEERVTLFWGHGLLLGGPCLSGWPHTHAHMGKTNCLGGY